MGFFSRLNSWQKGFVYGFLFTFFISCVFAAVLMIAEVRFHSLGLTTHYCFSLSKTVQCSYPDAILSRAGLGLMMTIFLGIPIGILGGILGHLVERIAIR